MSKIKSFHHYTIDGRNDHVAKRKDIGEGVTRIMRPFVSKAFRPQADVPGVPELMMTIHRQGDGCFFTLHLTRDHAPVVTCIFSPDGGEGRESLVDALKAAAWTDFDASSLPKGPLLAVAMQPGFAHLQPETMFLVADLCRCVAWTWIDHFS
ncbi:MAG: hypothetical protein ABS76_26655 [Pelagibacterium sp. SCN 64-44]|nr:MAG: hypothetical protein ABS76_26655 [Pelagibacterium sp. SCN 64-44]